MTLIEILEGYCLALRHGNRETAKRFLDDEEVDSVLHRWVIETFNDRGDLIRGDGSVFSTKTASKIW